MRGPHALILAPYTLLAVYEVVHAEKRVQITVQCVTDTESRKKNTLTEIRNTALSCTVYPSYALPHQHRISLRHTPQALQSHSVMRIRQPVPSNPRHSPLTLTKVQLSAVQYTSLHPLRLYGRLAQARISF